MTLKISIHVDLIVLNSLNQGIQRLRLNDDINIGRIERVHHLIKQFRLFLFRTWRNQFFIKLGFLIINHVLPLLLIVSYP